MSEKTEYQADCFCGAVQLRLRGKPEVMAYCHCEQARARVGDISVTHCYCGAGWYKNIMEGILGRKVSVEVVESILQGGKACVIAIHL